MELTWQKCEGDTWCSLTAVNLGHPHFDSMEGVYVIWQANGSVIRVGQGTVKDRIAAHRQDAQITAHRPLHSSWAPVPATFRDGIERYLANVLKPLVGSTFPNAAPIAVNLPWAWNG